MSKCLRCSFPKDQPKGDRVCRKCGRREGPPRGAPAPASTEGIEELLGLPTTAASPDGCEGSVADKAEPASAAGASGMSSSPFTAISEAVPNPAADDPALGPASNAPAADSPQYAPSNTAAQSVTSEGAGDAANATPAYAESEAVKVLPEVRAWTDEMRAKLEQSEHGHSPKGASGAKRWMNCSGSAVLVKQHGLVSEESEFAAYGTAMHALGARCLETDVDAWEIVHEYPVLKPRDAEYVQQYVDYVRSRPGRKRIEVHQARPELHSLMYGTIDAEIVPVLDHGHVLEVVDLKGGEGVYVDAEENEQMMYYAGLTIFEDVSYFPDDGEVILTICQPRMTWAETIRSWRTTVGEIKRWVLEQLIPAMNRDEADFVLGEWCQFCPAKLLCPKQKETLTELADMLPQVDGPYLLNAPPPVQHLTDEELGRRYVMWENVKTYGKALTEEVRKRLMDRKDVPGTKLTAGKSDRVWKNEAEDKARELFGDDAYTKPALLSPAQLEKLPHGKEFVAEFAYKPEAGYVVSLASSKKPAVVPRSGAELFTSVASQYLDAAE